jgi:hypothetical protein
MTAQSMSPVDTIHDGGARAVPATVGKSSGRAAAKHRKPTISATIIAQNEAENLAALMPRLDWVDEIVVVDGGSEDRTTDVARAHGARVALRRFDTYAGQRNHALGLARGDWILSIDADERPTHELAGEIRRRITERRYSAYRIPIRSTIFKRPVRWAGTQDDRPIRLFRRSSGRWIGDVHEVYKVSGRVGRIDAWLEHRTIPDLHALLAKIHRYTALEAAARVAAGESPRLLARWTQPPREVFRRLIWKHGWIDGPHAWAFCVLSGLSEWVLADRHRRLWHAALTDACVAKPRRAANRSLEPRASKDPLPGIGGIGIDIRSPLGTSPHFVRQARRIGLNPPVAHSRDPR